MNSKRCGGSVSNDGRFDKHQSGSCEGFKVVEGQGNQIDDFTKEPLDFVVETCSGHKVGDSTADEAVISDLSACLDKALAMADEDGSSSGSVLPVDPSEEAKSFRNSAGSEVSQDDDEMVPLSGSLKELFLDLVNHRVSPTNDLERRIFDGEIPYRVEKRPGGLDDDVKVEHEFVDEELKDEVDKEFDEVLGRAVNDIGLGRLEKSINELKDLFDVAFGQSNMKNLESSASGGLVCNVKAEDLNIIEPDDDGKYRKITTGFLVDLISISFQELRLEVLLQLRFLK